MLKRRVAPMFLKWYILCLDSRKRLFVALPHYWKVGSLYSYLLVFFVEQFFIEK